MYLYLVRHGEALSKEEDPDRGLSPDGIAHITQVAAVAKGIHISVKQIVHSGKKRAEQTALILSNVVRPAMGVLETEGLAPMDDPEVWHERISRSSENLMLVGHLPHLARLSSLLLCGGMHAEVLDFHAGSIACLHRPEDTDWAVDWMIRPGLIQ